MKVSVIMPLYNKEKYVKQSVESILNQTYNNFELIIVDDKSTDQSVETIKKYKDSRIYLMKLNENHGAAYAANIAIQNSQGEYILRMDADDIAEPTRLERQLKYALEENADMVGCQFGIFSEEKEIPQGLYRFQSFSNQILSMKDIIEYYTVMPTVVQPTMLLKRQLFEEDLFYNSKYKTAEDYEQLGRMIIKGKKIYKIPEVLLQYRYISTSLSNSRQLEGILNTIRIKLDFIYEYYNVKDIIKKRFIIWGIKEFAGYLEEELSHNKYEAEVKCFTDFDANSWGKEKNNLPIVSPEEMIKERKKNDIIITMWNLDRKEIIDFLEGKQLIMNTDFFVFS